MNRLSHLLLMINDKVFLGFPIKFKDVCEIYPPTVNEVVSNDDFGIYQSFFTITQEDLDDAYLKDETITQVPTPFQYLLMNYYQDEEIRQKIEDGFSLFVREPVTIIPEIEMLLIGKAEDDIDPDVDLENPRLLTEENFFDFQNQIRKVIGLKLVDVPAPDDVIEDPRIKRWKMKMKEREKILSVKKSKDVPTFGTLLAAICCMGIGLNPLNIGEMSYACVQWLISMYQQNEEYDIDIRSLLAGADSKKVKPKYWIKNID